MGIVGTRTGGWGLWSDDIGNSVLSRQVWVEPGGFWGGHDYHGKCECIVSAWHTAIYVLMSFAQLIP